MTDAPPRTVTIGELAPWMTAQRWYTGKGGEARLRILGSTALPVASPEPGASPDDEVRIEIVLVLDEGELAPALYQVPVTHRPAGRVPEGAVVVVEHDGGLIVDGPTDPAFAAALLQACITSGPVADGGDIAVQGAPLGAPPEFRVQAAKLLAGEQSNSSIIARVADPAGGPLGPVIMKVFRALHHGENPDVVLQGAIAAAGSTRVPRTYGALVGEWPDRGRIEGRAIGHLAVAQEFLPGTEDAWRVVLRAIDDNVDFHADAAALGDATAEVHEILRTALPTQEADRARVTALIAGMRTRAAEALRADPGLAKHARTIGRIIDAAASAPWPPLQRIHGDYHLGQVLLADGRGAGGGLDWVLLDFEGEPLRPMAERSEPDLALRDVAGMLRSFDYAAGAHLLTADDEDAAAARSWAGDTRDAFLEGYAARTGRPPAADHALLTALELDKALYELVYESRNRPDWVGIPRAAIERLIASA